MKVWWCEVHNAEAVNNDDLPEEQTECWLYLGLSLGEKPIAPCRMVEMQLVPADARIVTSSDPELRETIIGLMTSRDWYDWPTDEQYLQECVTEALDGLGKTANV